MKRTLVTFVILLITSFTIISIAQSECPTLVEAALNSTDEFCEATGRNEACFGHVNLAAEGQPDAMNFDFVTVGDIVDVASIRSLRLSTLDTSAGAWGVVMMRVQANLPDSLPGQNVTFMLFGDTEIRNVASSVAEQQITSIDAQVTSSINANVRVGPNSTMAVVATLSPDTRIVANGLSPNREWVRILIPNSETSAQGWISNQLISTTDDFSTLNVITPGQPQFGPMQAFYLSTGIGNPVCNEVPDNGLLVQTPKGVGEINLLVNEVEISMGSTVFLSAPRDDDGNDDENINATSMKVKTIEGAAISRVSGQTTVALGGSQFEVMYDDDGEIAEVSRTISLASDEIDNLPFDALERDIEIEASLTDEELDILDQYDEIFDFVDIDDTDELLDYLDEFGDDELLDFLQDDLEYEYFDGDISEFFEDELDLDIEGFNDEFFDDASFEDEYDYGDEYTDEYGDGYGDEYGYEDPIYGDEYSYDEYGDEYGYEEDGGDDDYGY